MTDNRATPATRRDPFGPSMDEIGELVMEYGRSEYDCAAGPAGPNPTIETVMATRRRLISAIEQLHRLATATRTWGQCPSCGHRNWATAFDWSGCTCADHSNPSQCAVHGAVSATPTGRQDGSDV